MAETGIGVARYQAQEILCFYYHECADYSVNLESVVTKPGTLKEELGVSKTVKREYTLYPNPANTWLAIELPLNTEKVEIKILDVSGKTVLQQRVGKPIFIWETAAVSNGTYIITISRNGNSMGTERVIVQH